VTVTSAATVLLRTHRVNTMRTILGRLRGQEDVLAGTASVVDPSNSDYNPQVVTAADATLTHVQSQLHTLKSLLAGQFAGPPFTRPLRRLSAATRRLQDAATYLRLAVVDVQAGNDAAATELSRVTDPLRRARNALNRAQVLLGTI
jgi:hypothetical protein